MAAVPVASFAKSNVNISQVDANVVNASVSTLMVGFPASSTFNLTGIPASGDHTITVIVVFPEENGIAVAKPDPVPGPMVVPAQT